MKKKFFFLTLATLATLLCACSKDETYTCGYCIEEVTQEPIEISILGQDIKVCDDCFKMLEDYMVTVK